jgi:hypothetical protein
VLGLLAAIIAAPLTTSQAFGLLATSPIPKVDELCEPSVSLVLHGSSEGLKHALMQKQSPLTVRCVSSPYVKVKQAIDSNTQQCLGGLEREECQAWLVHARSFVLDALIDDKSTASDFAHLMSAMTAIGFKDTVSPEAATRALASAARLSASHPQDMYIQRLALAAWMLIPGGGAEIGDILKRALAINAADPDLLSAIVVLAEHTNSSDVAATLADNVVKNAKTPTARAYALYLSGCISLQKNDKVAANDYFSTAAKNDPFDGRYAKAVKETEPGSKVEAKCSLTFSPFSQALKTAIATKR